MRVDSLKKPVDQPSLLFVDLGSPDVEQQDHTGLGRVVHRFVFDGVVERPGLTQLPFADLVADAERTAAGDDQRQVTDQTRVDEAVVRRDARARAQQREQDGR